MGSGRKVCTERLNIGWVKTKRVNCGGSRKRAMRNGSFSDKGRNGKYILRFWFRKVVSEEAKEGAKEQIREQTRVRRTGKNHVQCQCLGVQKMTKDFGKLAGLRYWRGNHRTGAKCSVSSRQHSGSVLTSLVSDTEGDKSMSEPIDVSTGNSLSTVTWWIWTSSF